MRKFLAAQAILALLSSSLFAYRSDMKAQEQKELREVYSLHCRSQSDIYEHLPTLRQLAMECPRVVELGLRMMNSSWGLLQGLSENPASSVSYTGIDAVAPEPAILQKAERLAKGNAIAFKFINGNDLFVDIPQCDLLFIDTLQTYCHMTYELEKFNSKVSTYIAVHDTSAPWGEVDDTSYNGTFVEYPGYIDRKKKGVWPAVNDFLKRHPEWKLQQRFTNNHGFTILKRVKK